MAWNHAPRFRKGRRTDREDSCGLGRGQAATRAIERASPSRQKDRSRNCCVRPASMKAADPRISETDPICCPRRGGKRRSERASTRGRPTRAKEGQFQRTRRSRQASEQGNARCVEWKVNQSSRKIETTSRFAEGALTAEHVNKQDRSHKDGERLKEVSKRSFQASWYALEPGDFGVTRAGRPTITALKASCVGGNDNLD
jgi:hypothetical protein